MKALLPIMLLLAACALPARSAPEDIPPEEVLYADEAQRRIELKGRVVRDEGEVQFLAVSKGYSWLEEESAVVIPARLKDIQRAASRIDWEIFDDIWFDRSRGERVEITMVWNRTAVPAAELIHAPDAVFAAELFFWGSPYFDHIALDESTPADCSACPVFPLEQKALRESFVRPSGASGYELISSRMPPAGAEVIIILEFR